MAQIAKELKKMHPDCITVFCGPCTAKKMEALKPDVKQYVDYVITFDELRAMVSAKDIEIDKLKGISVLDDATEYGRGFASCGGLANAVVQVLKEIGETKFKLCAKSCSGMKECIEAIKAYTSGQDKTTNFIEGMACEGGCVNGAGSIIHNTYLSKALLNIHSKTAKQKTIKESSGRFIKK